MLEYNPATKLYLVKRVHVSNHVLGASGRKEQTEKEGQKITRGGWVYDV